MRVKYWLTALGLAALSACGGSVSVGLNVDSGGLQFILWSGNFNGDLILNADDQRFAFYTDNGCLYNFQTDRRNTSFCIGSGNLIRYQGFHIRIVNIQSVEGTCVAALVDYDTARFVDIRLDASGREEIHLASNQPVPCAG